MNFPTDIDISDTSFSLIDRIDLLGSMACQGLSASRQSLSSQVSRPMAQPAMTI
jgi:hypothetical protein